MKDVLGVELKCGDCIVVSKGNWLEIAVYHQGHHYFNISQWQIDRLKSGKKPYASFINNDFSSRVVKVDEELVIGKKLIEFGITYAHLDDQELKDEFGAGVISYLNEVTKYEVAVRDYIKTIQSWKD